MSVRILTVILALLIFSPVRADTFTWAGGDGNFSDPASWSGAAPVPGGSAADQLVLPTAVTATNAYTVTDDLSGSPWILNSLVLGSVYNGMPASITLNGTPLSSLRFDGPNPSITVSPMGLHTIIVPIASTSNLTINGLRLTLTAPLSFSASDSQLNLNSADVIYQNNTPPAGLNQTVITGSGLHWFYTPGSSPAVLSFGLGTITLDTAANFGLYYLPPDPQPTSSVEITNPIVVKGDNTKLIQWGLTSVTFSGPVRLAGQLQFQASSLSLAGTVTLDQSITHTLSIGNDYGNDDGIAITGNLIDDPDPSHTARNPLHLTGFGSNLVVSGTANNYSTGTIIDRGIVTVAPNSTLGTGNISIGDSASYWLFPQLNLNSPNTYSAAAHVDVYGTLALVGPAGAIPITSAPPTLYAASNLVLGDNLNNNSDRYPDSMAVALSSSTLQLLGYGNTTESVGAISIAGNSSIILQNPAAGLNTTTLHAPSLTRIDNAILLITPVNGTLGQGVNNVNLVFDSPPVVANNMLPPYIQMAETRFPTSPDPNPPPFTPSFVTYGPNGITSTSYTTMPTNGGTGTEIVDISENDNNTILFRGNTHVIPDATPRECDIQLLHAVGVPYNAFAFPTTTSIYALRTSTSIAISSTIPITLTLQSGGLITYNYATSSDVANTITIQPNLDFGPGEAIIHTAASPLYYEGFPTEISGKVTIRNGLTKFGFGPLVLSNPANDISGAITVFQGDLTLFAIPQATSSVPIALYPNCSITTQSNQTLSRPILLFPDDSARATIGISSGNTLTLASPITGNGLLIVQGGILVLSPTFTWHPPYGQLAVESALELPGARISLPTSITISGGLSGSGTLADFTTIFMEGTIAPGLTPGEIATLKFDSPTGLARLGWSETVALDLDPSGSCDQLIFTGPLMLEPTLDANYPTTIALHFLAPPTGESYTLISASCFTGTFSQVTGLPDGYVLDYTPTSLLLVPATAGTSVPEPATALLVLGFVPLLVKRSRR